MLKAGILTPRSTLYPSLTVDLMNGLKLSLKQQNIFDEVELLIENIGYGTDEADIYARTEKLLLQHDVDLVIVFADSIIAEMLQPLFTATSKILLMVNFGANFPKSWKPDPTSITLSLNFCMHAKLTGKLAALESGKDAANVVSYYDGGYNQCYCMLNSHQENGGVPLFNHITHLKMAEFTLEPLQRFLEEHKEVHTLLCLFAGDQAEKFYQEIPLLQQTNNLNLFVSPMMLNETLKFPDAVNVKNVKGYIPWHESLKNEENHIFTQQVISNTDKPANYFSLLGWETGLLLAAISSQMKSGNNGAPGIIRSITGIVFNSPRGWFKIDSSTHLSYGPSMLACYNNDMKINVVNDVADIETAWVAFTHEQLPGRDNSSWRNTYLCI